MRFQLGDITCKPVLLRDSPSRVGCVIAPDFNYKPAGFLLIKLM